MKIATRVYNEIKEALTLTFEGAASDGKELSATLASPLQKAFIFALERAENYVPAAKRQLNKMDARRLYDFILVSNRIYERIGRLRLGGQEPVQDEKSLSHAASQMEFKTGMKARIENHLNNAGYDSALDEPYVKVLRLKGGKNEFDLAMK